MSIVRNENGYVIVDVGDGAQMTCPTGELEWRLRYGDAAKAALVAASALDSYDYLVNHCNKDEAWRRIKIMRSALQSRYVDQTT